MKNQTYSLRKGTRCSNENTVSKIRTPHCYLSCILSCNSGSPIPPSFIQLISARNCRCTLLYSFIVIVVFSSIHPTWERLLYTLNRCSMLYSNYIMKTHRDFSSGCICKHYEVACVISCTQWRLYCKHAHLKIRCLVCVNMILPTTYV